MIHSFYVGSNGIIFNRHFLRKFHHSKIDFSIYDVSYQIFFMDIVKYFKRILLETMSDENYYRCTSERNGTCRVL